MPATTAISKRTPSITPPKRSRACAKRASPRSKTSFRAPRSSIRRHSSGDKVKFGAIVELEDMDNGKIVTYRLVGPDESDIKQGKISITSPVARASWARKSATRCGSHTPGGVRHYEVSDVRWELKGPRLEGTRAGAYTARSSCRNPARGSGRRRVPICVTVGTNRSGTFSGFFREGTTTSGRRRRFTELTLRRVRGGRGRRSQGAIVSSRRPSGVRGAARAAGGAAGGRRLPRAEAGLVSGDSGTCASRFAEGETVRVAGKVHDYRGHGDHGASRVASRRRARARSSRAIPRCQVSGARYSDAPCVPRSIAPWPKFPISFRRALRAELGASPWARRFGRFTFPTRQPSTWQLETLSPAHQRLALEELVLWELALRLRRASERGGVAQRFEIEPAVSRPQLHSRSS